jgi:hypothetical protein
MLPTQEVRVDYFILSEKKTGAFSNNSWRISPGGQWRIAAATGAPPRPQPSGMRAAETEAAGRPLLGGCAGVTGEVPV